MNVFTKRCLRICSTFLVPKSIPSLCNIHPRFGEGTEAKLTKAMIIMKAVSIGKSIAKSSGGIMQGTAPGALYNGMVDSMKHQ